MHTSTENPIDSIRGFVDTLDPMFLTIAAGLLAFIGLLLYLKTLLRGPRPGEKTLNDFPKEMENAGLALGFMAVGTVVFLMNPTPQKVFLVSTLVLALAGFSLVHGMMRRPLSQEESRDLIAGNTKVHMQYPLVKFGLVLLAVVLFVVALTMDS